jgi:hypothetical protein
MRPARYSIAIAVAAACLSIVGANAKSRAISTDQPSVIANGNQQITEPAGSHIMAMYIWSRSYALFDTSEGVGTPASDEDRVIVFDQNAPLPNTQPAIFCNTADGAAGNCTTSVFGDVQDLGISNGAPLLLALVADNPLSVVKGDPVILGTPADMVNGFLDWVPKTGGYATFDFANEEEPAPGAVGLPPPTTAEVYAALAQYPGGSNAQFVGFQDWYNGPDPVLEYQYDAAVIAVWTVSTAPETSTWIMLFVGLFGMGAAVRSTVARRFGMDI